MMQSLSKIDQMREAVLLTFCERVPDECDRLRHLSGKDWQKLLFWLDTSGLALYFLDRLEEIKMIDVLPPVVRARLVQNRIDNKAKTEALIDESAAIQRIFQQQEFSYAMLKGFSLWPISVPKPELRSQLDIDFLLAEEHANDARKILEKRGYYLHAISGRSWEFKSKQSGTYSLKDLYKPTPQRSIELHIERRGAGINSVLARREKLCFHGTCMSVLSPVDLFLGQGLHLAKHLCSEHTRAAHLIEFRRHIVTRYSDDAFWEQLKTAAKHNPNAPNALGFAMGYISHLMGDFAPEALKCWTVDHLAREARLWVDLYARRTMLRGFPGNKLYLLLEREWQANAQMKHSLRQSLLPLRLPPAITRAEHGESLASRLRRWTRQSRVIIFRLHFHSREGCVFLVESVRWNWHLKKFRR